MSEHDELNALLAGSATKAASSPIASYGRPPKVMYEDESMNTVTQSLVQWTTSDNKIFVPASHTKSRLIPGVYEIKSSPNVGTYFEQIPVRTEGLLRFPDTNSELVVEEIQKFWSKEVEKQFKDYGLAYKRGILLWGPPGSGKSCTLQLIMQDVIERQGVVIKFDDPFLYIDGMRKFRQIQPDTPVVTTLEDIDSIIAINSETEVLNILDGVNDVSKTVFLATTNYPEQLGDRVVNRPSRFDKRYKIGMPSAVARKMYFESLIKKKDVKKSKVNIDKWVADTKNLSVAHLKELFINVIIFGNDYEKAVTTLQSMKEKIDDKEYNMGFHNLAGHDQVED